MAVRSEVLDLDGTNVTRVFSDGEGDTIFLRSDRLEQAFGGGGDDRIIVRQNGLTSDGLTFLPPDDFVNGEAGNDTIIVEERRSGDITYQGGRGNDAITIVRDADRDGRKKIGITILGDNDSFTNTSGHGNDTISPGPNAEFIDGGGGIDALEFLTADVGVFVVFGEIQDDGSLLKGQITEGPPEVIDRFIRMENALGSIFADRLLGNGIDNHLDGRQGQDTLYGGAGDDLINGGADDDVIRPGPGDDTADGGSGSKDLLDYSDIAARVSANLFRGTASFTTDGERSSHVVSRFEWLRGSNQNDRLTGDQRNNEIQGLAGRDVLSGAAGNDHLFGQKGNDILNGNNGADTLEGGQGNDRLFGQDGPDRLLGAQGNDLLRGEDGADVLAGGSGLDTLEGGKGDDFFIAGRGGDDIRGGAGARDAVDYSGAGTGWTVNLSAGRGQATGGGANDLYSSIERVFGSPFDDRIVGTGRNDTLEGGEGNDTFSGGAGDDLFVGGPGIDLVRYGNSPVGIRIDLFTGTVTNASGSEQDTLQSIELIEGSGGDDTLRGNDEDNLLEGSNGNDILYGFGGDDTINGGRGRDTIEGEGGQDVMNGGRGRDLIEYDYSPSGWVVDLAAETATSLGGPTVERIRNFEDAVTGGSDDELLGNSKANALNGAGGNDRLEGHGGNDSLDGDRGFDTLIGGNGNDTLRGFTENDRLEGGPGNDLLDGSFGGDILIGGPGRDTFIYTDNRQSTEATRDRIRASENAPAFERGMDVIDLSAIDADRTVAGDQPFRIRGDEGPGKLTFTDRDGVTVITAQMDNDDQIEMLIEIEDGLVTANSYREGDFIL